MNGSKEILEELKQNSPSLVAAQGMQSFRAPADYFDNLSAEIMASIEAELVVPVKTAAPYIAPDHYFTYLADNILSTVQAISAEQLDELASIAPVLSGVGKNETYRVPVGYFSETPAMISAAVLENISGKPAVIKYLRRWIQYAAAAVVGGILVTGAFMYTDSKSYLDQEMLNKPSLNKETTPTPSSVINNNGKEASVNDDEVIKEDETVKESAKPNEEIRLTDFAKKIQLLSDDELKKYLEENTVPEPVSLVNDTSEI
jgi:hypothetical protein